MSLVSTQIQSNPFLFHFIQIKPTPHVLSLHYPRQSNSSISSLTFKRCPIRTGPQFNSMTRPMLIEHHPTQQLPDPTLGNLNHRITQCYPIAAQIDKFPPIQLIKPSDVTLIGQRLSNPQIGNSFSINLSNF